MIKDGDKTGNTESSCVVVKIPWASEGPKKKNQSRHVQRRMKKLEKKRNKLGLASNEGDMKQL